MATPEVIFTISIIVIPYYSSQTIVLFLLSPSQSSGGQKRWPSQMGAATHTQLYPAIILTSYLTAWATQRWKLSIKTFKKKYCKILLPIEYRIFSQLKSLVYADFVDSNGEPYLKDTREHTEARVYVKALWLWTGSMTTIKTKYISPMVRK